MMTFDFDTRSSELDRLHAATGIFTAEHIVRMMLLRVGWPTPTGRLIDPSAGDGAIVCEALAALNPAPGDFAAASRVEGWEIHPVAAHHARSRVQEQLAGAGWSGADAATAARRMIVEADFLKDGPEVGDFAFIVGNPPYWRRQSWGEYWQNEYSFLEPHAAGDLLHAFLDKCAGALREDGVITLISSDRWLFNETTADLREKLGEVVGLDLVERVDENSCFRRPKYRRAGTPPRVWPVQVIFRRAGRARVPLTRAAISPDEFGQAPTAPTRTLSAIANVRLAPWLGPAGIFVVNDATARGFDGHPMFPAVDTDNIDPATDELLPPNRFALVTRADQEPEGIVRDHLWSHRDEMPKRKGNRPWWMPPETITLDLSQPSLLIPRIARRLRPVHLPAGILPVNHNLSVVTQGRVPLEEVRRILLSEASQGWITRNAPRLENGFYSITTGLLRRLPIG